MWLDGWMGYLKLFKESVKTMYTMPTLYLNIT
jgi:hypothetical protein